MVISNIIVKENLGLNVSAPSEAEAMHHTKSALPTNVRRNLQENSSMGETKDCFHMNIKSCTICKKRYKFESLNCLDRENR